MRENIAREREEIPLNFPNNSQVPLYSRIQGPEGNFRTVYSGLNSYKSAHVEGGGGIDEFRCLRETGDVY